ncbi:MAG: hypothetical protein Q4A15_10510 [Prevotellaceae bacterium]|nr:hypothetical protein [Prevotellaceae bacterium]
MSEHYCVYKDGMCELDVDEAYEQGKADMIEECIDKFAEIMSNMHQICGRSCPVDCNWGTTTNCKDKCKKWLKKQLKEQNNENI